MRYTQSQRPIQMMQHIPARPKINGRGPPVHGLVQQPQINYQQPVKYPHQMPPPIQTLPTQTPSKKGIGNYEFLLTDVIGEGFSSVVYKGKSSTKGEICAIKVIDMRKIQNDVEKLLLENELRVLQKLNSKYVLDVKDIYQTANNTYIVTEYCNQGDMAQLIEKNKHIPEEQGKKYLYQIVKGLEELFKKKVIHRDIKPANIMLNDNICKIVDLGFCHDSENDRQCDTYYNVGSPNYMCPKSLTQNQYSYQSDIWSLGILYYEMLYGKIPWIAENEKDLVKQIHTIPLYFPPEFEVSELSKNFIRKCLSIDENERFDHEEIVLHPLIRQNEPDEQKKSSQMGFYNPLDIKDKADEINSIQQNDKIILSQINYCRFLFRLFKMSQQFSILENSLSQQKMEFLILKNIYQKVSKLFNIENNEENHYNLIDLPRYKNGENFQKFVSAIGQYYNKYQKVFFSVYQNLATKNNLRPDKYFESEFDTILNEYPVFYNNFMWAIRLCIREMNHLVKIKMIRLQITNFLPDDMQEQVVLIDYFVTLFQLCTLITQNYGNYDFFVENSKIDQIADGIPIKLTIQHYNSIRQKIYSLDI